MPPPWKNLFGYPRKYPLLPTWKNPSDIHGCKNRDQTDLQKNQQTPTQSLVKKSVRNKCALVDYDVSDTVFTRAGFLTDSIVCCVRRPHCYVTMEN